MNGLNETSRVAEKPEIFDRLAVLSDPIRCRLLLVLEAQELTVSEICSILQLPQSTVSRHLKTLADDGWVRARRDGTSRLYSAVRQAHQHGAQRLWQLLRDEVMAGSAASQDQARLEEIMTQRRSKSQEFFSSAAGQWAQLRQQLFGSRFDLLALLALLEEDWVVGDLGCGTGQTAASLAPFVGKVIAVDDSKAMLTAARERLGKTGNVELRQGRLESLPIEDETLDAAVLGLVLHHLPDPPRVLQEACRALKPNGRILVVDMLPHEREDYRQEMGHVWLGFEQKQLEDWLAEAGFGKVAFRALPPEQQAKGPNIFTASAQRLVV
jgi:ubiquinone/menaquinone biosynthesis C-methylase UbiE/DNA-binding transcriptional ArsR family regulator